jgi:hypothetical protein
MALCAIDQVSTDFGCFANSPIGFVQQFYGVGLSFVAMIALIGLIIGGYTLMMSKGDPGRVSAGKSWIFYAIVGLLVAIFGYVIIQVIAVDILKVPGFS